MSNLKNSDCVKEVTSYVIKEFKNKSAPGDLQNYSLFSGLVKEAIVKYVPDKEKFIKQKPWEDENITKMRSVLQQGKFKFQHCRTPENKQIAATSAKILSDLYILKENQYYTNLSEELMKLSGDNQHAAAWKHIDKISGRKARTKYVINADSEEERSQ